MIKKTFGYIFAKPNCFEVSQMVNIINLSDGFFAQASK